MQPPPTSTKLSFSSRLFRAAVRPVGGPERRGTTVDSARMRREKVETGAVARGACRSVLLGPTHRFRLPGRGARLQTCSSILPWCSAAAAVVPAQVLTTGAQSLAALQTHGCSSSPPLSCLDTQAATPSPTLDFKITKNYLLKTKTLLFLLLLLLLVHNFGFSPCPFGRRGAS